jgi:hypothetical protein
VIKKEFCDGERILDYLGGPDVTICKALYTREQQESDSEPAV